MPDPNAIQDAETDDPSAVAAVSNLAVATPVGLPQLSANALQAYDAISNALADPTFLTAQPFAAAMQIAPGANVRDLDVVLGVGIGFAEDPDDPVSDPGEGCLQLYTSQPVTKDEAVNYVDAAFGVSALATGNIPVRVIHTGPIDALSHRFQARPAPGGVSIGHRNITAGTLGCLAQGRAAPRDARMLVLSNNHVLANVNSAAPGDIILQPGPADGGVVGTHDIGFLERFVTISFTNTNYVDCATAWVDPGKVRPELVYLRSGIPQHFRTGTTPKTATVGMTVGKSGRTTQLRVGRVVGVNARIRVNMGGGRIALFDDQITIQGVNGDFSRGGDSGSLVWEWTGGRDPIGLLFAGGGSYTFANPIGRVLNALDIDLI
ncbi:MAG: hypothetical protein KC619_09245 [Myxococcales bacterium]|nr:hypothetical protein [Myxococcales bacterium]